MKVKVFINPFKNLRDTAKLVSKYFDIDNENPDFAISIGGDGTALRTFTYDLPTLAVKIKESHGGICVVDIDNLEEALVKIKEGKYHIEERNRISVTYGTFYQGSALNEFTLQKTRGYETVTYTIQVGDKIYTGKGDGVIVSTMTGALAYNVNAGGIVFDDDNKFAITHICPLEGENLLVDAKTIYIKLKKPYIAKITLDSFLEMTVDKDIDIILRPARKKAQFIIPEGYVLKKPDPSLYNTKVQ